MNSKFNHIGEVVRLYRKAAQLTLQGLADQLDDYDAGNLSRFERGKQGMSEERLKETASALGTTPGQLYTTLETGKVAPKPGQEDKIHTAKEFMEQHGREIYQLPPKELMRLLTQIEKIIDEFLDDPENHK